MSWGDYYQRRDAIDRVLAHVGHDAHLPDVVPDMFDGREELALALQYRWSQALNGRIAVALVDTEHQPDSDHLESVASAWRATARLHPELRALLDDYAPEAGATFREAQRAEQRMLALAAGLADAHEPRDEITRIGAAFLALIRETREGPTSTRTCVVDQLFRRLVASS